MTLENTDFEAIVEGDLLNLIAVGVPEGLVLEYKRDTYGPKEADRKGALKDISSFANSAASSIGVMSSKAWNRLHATWMDYGLSTFHHRFRQ